MKVEEYSRYRATMGEWLRSHSLYPVCPNCENKSLDIREALEIPGEHAPRLIAVMECPVCHFLQLYDYNAIRLELG